MESRVDIRDPALSTSAINGSNERSRMRPRYAIQFQRVWLTRYYSSCGNLVSGSGDDSCWHSKARNAALA